MGSIFLLLFCFVRGRLGDIMLIFSHTFFFFFIFHQNLSNENSYLFASSSPSFRVGPQDSGPATRSEIPLVTFRFPPPHHSTAQHCETEPTLKPVEPHFMTGSVFFCFVLFFLLPERPPPPWNTGKKKDAYDPPPPPVSNEWAVVSCLVELGFALTETRTLPAHLFDAYLVDG